MLVRNEKLVSTMEGRESMLMELTSSNERLKEELVKSRRSMRQLT